VVWGDPRGLCKKKKFETGNEGSWGSCGVGIKQEKHPGTEILVMEKKAAPVPKRSCMQQTKKTSCQGADYHEAPRQIVSGWREGEGRRKSRTITLCPQKDPYRRGRRQRGVLGLK